MGISSSQPLRSFSYIYSVLCPEILPKNRLLEYALLPHEARVIILNALNSVPRFAIKQAGACIVSLLCYATCLRQDAISARLVICNAGLYVLELLQIHSIK